MTAHVGQFRGTTTLGYAVARENYRPDKKKGKMPRLSAVNVDRGLMYSGLGISRHPPVIRFRQAFKDLRRGNTNATVPVLLAGMVWMDLCCCLLG
jgi:hypothetical protein